MSEINYCHTELKNCICICHSPADIYYPIYCWCNCKEKYEPLFTSEIQKDVTHLLNQFHGMKNRMDALEKENEMRKDTLVSIDQAYSDIFLNLEKKINYLQEERDLGIERIKRLEEKINRLESKNLKLSDLKEGCIVNFDLPPRFESNKKPYKCPVCYGCGGTTITGTIDEFCNACEGKGIVWG